MQMELEDYTLDQKNYDNMISYLEAMDTFKAIRCADEINKLNGFEIVSRVLIKEWKRELYRQNEKIKMEFL